MAGWKFGDPHNVPRLFPEIAAAMLQRQQASAIIDA